MPEPIKVLIVDDSAVARLQLSRGLSGDPSITIVGSAANGRIALELTGHLRPDIVVLDIEMPEMDGLETLRKIREQDSNIFVIMFSALTEQGAATTLEALSLGANDFLAKPSALGGKETTPDQVYKKLVTKIKSWARHRPSPDPGRKAHSVKKEFISPIKVIVIAASTGGPNALTSLFTKLPADLQVPILIAIHMPPVFTKMFAERLTAVSKIKVSEAIPGAVLSPGCAWVAPGDYHMAVEQSGNDVIITTNQAPPEHSCRPAADVLFRSVAWVFASNTLAVVLTGMGQDGLAGSRAIAEAGGEIIVQDKASSVVWSMPGNVAAAGLASDEVSIHQMSEAILKRVAERPAIFRPKGGKS